MSTGRETPVGPRPVPDVGDVSHGPFVDHEKVPPDMVDEASHGSGRRNADKSGSRDLRQVRGGQGRPAQPGDDKRAPRR